MDETTPIRFSLRARCVLPIAGPPLDAAWVTIHDGRIASVDRRDPGGAGRDLGDVILVPGLVNAHTHLNLSDLAAPLGRPGTGLVHWIGQVMRHRLERPATPQTIADGLRECVRLGSTAVVDVAQDAPPADVVASLGLNLISCIELIAPTADRVAQQWVRADAHLAAAAAASWQPGLSPHAPYSVRPEVLDHAVALSAERRVPLAMHVAESPEEMELLHHGDGPLREMLERLGAWDPEAFAQGLTVLDYLKTLARAHRALVIHGNYLADEDITFLAAHADRMAVVYCPRSHAFFAHDPYPLEKLLAAGATVALGTDSRASSPDLSLLADMREAHRRHPGVSCETIVRLGTLGGATALGLANQIGTIEPGRRADLVAVAVPPDDRRASTDPYRWLLETDAPVTATWCAGRPVDNVS
jgi:aminodeoxyfutalosine deaminase